MKTSAIFSECRNYRYALSRIWNEEKPPIVFIGLNPSTANETENDPTIRRVIRFAYDWGYGGAIMMNLFAIVSPDPTVLKTCSDPIGDNDKLLNVTCEGRDILFAWGSFKEAKERAAEIINRFPDAYCLGKNADGSPKHPLYIAAKTPRIKFHFDNTTGKCLNDDTSFGVRRTIKPTNHEH